MKRAVLVLAFAGLAFGQIPENSRTNDFFNCRWWNGESDDARLGFIMGYSDIWDAIKDLAPLSNALNKATFGEIRSGVTAVCSRPENGIITVLDALWIFAARVAGVSESAVEESIAFTRHYRSLPKSEQKKILAPTQDRK
jgi:hypothetical protein